jgi:hypothetical protein
MHTFPRAILRQLENNEVATWWESFKLPVPGAPTRPTTAEPSRPSAKEFPKNFSIRFGAHRDSICWSSLTSRAGPLTPSAQAAVRAAHAAALTHRHPIPVILEEGFPPYAEALASMPEEPTPVTLPTLAYYPSSDMEMEEGADRGDHPPGQEQQGGTALPPTPEGGTPGRQAPPPHHTVLPARRRKWRRPTPSRGEGT